MPARCCSAAWLSVLVCALLVPAAGSGQLPAGLDGSPVVRVSPARSVEDQPLVIRVSGLAPRAGVTLGIRSTDAQGFVWVGKARFVADGRGSVDLRRAAPQGGSYAGVWPMGLVVSMSPTRPDPVPYAWTGPHAGLRTFAVTARVGGRAVASTSFQRSWSARRLSGRDETVSSAGFFGTFISAVGARRRTAVLVFGGSEGGLHTAGLASRFAAAGYPALALAYFREPGLPQTLTNVPLEYFQAALAWLAKQPQVDPSRIVVLGISRGSEAALLLGVHYPELVHGVIALVPGNSANCGIEGYPQGGACIGAAWTLGGKPLPYTRQFRNPNPTDVPDAVIPVEQIKAPLLLACGGVDQVWPSCIYAEAITRRLRAADNRSPHFSYAYLDAGHPVGALLPYEPGSTRLDTNVPFDEQAREQLWPHVLAFLHRLDRTGSH